MPSSKVICCCKREKKQTISLCGVLAETCGTRQSLATFFQERYERTHEEHQAHAKSTANIWIPLDLATYIVRCFVGRILQISDQSNKVNGFSGGNTGDLKSTTIHPGRRWIARRTHRSVRPRFLQGRDVIQFLSWRQGFSKLVLSGTSLSFNSC
jgi:hypothetical protein